MVEATVPLCANNIGGGKRKKKWMTLSTMNDIQRKEDAWLRYRKKPNTKWYKIYKGFRNNATRSVRKAKYEYELGLATEVKSNPRAFYAYARSKTVIKEQVLSIRDSQGNLSGSLQEAGETLNQSFQKVFVNTNNVMPPDLPPYQEEKVADIQATKKDVEELLMALKPSAPGPDGVHPLVLLLKSCNACLSEPLMKIFNESLKSGCIPMDWKRANISPIYKKGCRSEPLNYRPISLTSAACKILERIIKKQLVLHLESANLLSKTQHGFRSGKSCTTTQLLEYLYDAVAENALDNGDSVDAVYF